MSSCLSRVDWPAEWRRQNHALGDGRREAACCFAAVAERHKGRIVVRVESPEDR
jgi:hypothetical protein